MDLYVAMIPVGVRTERGEEILIHSGDTFMIIDSIDIDDHQPNLLVFLHKGRRVYKQCEVYTVALWARKCR